MYPFSAMMAAGAVAPARLVGAPTTQAGAATSGTATLTKPTGLAVNDLLIIITPHDGGLPAPGGTAVTSWSSIQVNGGGYDLDVWWGQVVDAAGTLTYAASLNTGLMPIICAAYRGARALVSKSTVSGLASNPSLSGFTKNGRSRGVLFAFANFGQTSPSAGATNFTMVTRYTLSPGAYANLQVGFGFSSEYVFPNATTITTSNLTYSGSTPVDAALLEFV